MKYECSGWKPVQCDESVHSHHLQATNRAGPPRAQELSSNSQGSPRKARCLGEGSRQRESVQVHRASRQSGVISGNSALVCKFLDKTKSCRSSLRGGVLPLGKKIHLTRDNNPHPRLSRSSLQGCIPSRQALVELSKGHPAKAQQGAFASLFRNIPERLGDGRNGDRCRGTSQATNTAPGY